MWETYQLIHYLLHLFNARLRPDADAFTHNESTLPLPKTDFQEK